MISKFLPLKFLGESILPTPKVKNLGVIMDADASFSPHITQVSRSCMYHIRDLARLRPHLNHDVAVLLANALVGSKLDYCNSLLYNLPKKVIKPLQRAQNILARIVTRNSRSTPASKSLHWLPVEHRISFKWNLLTYKALETGKPAYLKSYLQPYTSGRDTRRANATKKNLHTPFHKQKTYPKFSYLSRTFFYSAPRLWNSLPINIRTASSLGIMRRHLKTSLFSQAYPP